MKIYPKQHKTNMDKIALIKAEIERLKSNMDDRDPLAPNQKAGYLFALADVLSFISTLESEKPINQEKFSKEFDDYFLPKNREQKGRWRFAKIYDLARHFYELGCRRTAEKFDEIEYNRQRAEESVPNDLEEAAWGYASKECEKDAFIAGAEWQYQKDRGKFAQIKAKTWCEGFDACKEQMPLPEDTVLFNKGVEEGKRLMMEEWLKDRDGCFWDGVNEGKKAMEEQMMKDGNVILTEEDFDAEKEKSMEWGYNLCKDQMMKEAVEGEVMDFSSNQPRPQVDVLLDPHKYHTGDKVRIIIVKEDGK